MVTRDKAKSKKRIKAKPKIQPTIPGNSDLRKRKRDFQKQVAVHGLHSKVASETRDASYEGQSFKAGKIGISTSSDMN